VVLTLLASITNYASNLIFSRVLSPASFGDLTALLALLVVITVPTGAAQTVKVPLRLGSGRWLVETVTDGASGLVREPHVVRGGDSLDVPVLTDGGFAALACRWQPGRTTCDR